MKVTTISYRHYRFFRFLLQKNLRFQQHENRITIKENESIIVILERGKTTFTVVYTNYSIYLGIVITQKTYRQIILMRKFV